MKSNLDDNLEHQHFLLNFNSFAKAYVSNK